MEKNKTPLAKLIDLEKQLITDSINYKSSSWNKGYLAAMRTFINKAKELLSEERKMVEGAFDKSRERINHPDWDYIYDDFKDFFDQTYEQ